jgi:hypothetical protein
MADFDLEYKDVLEVIGKPNVSIRFEQSYLRSLEGRFPKNYLTFLDVIGAGTFKDGYFQICKPDQYRSIVKMIFEHDPVIDFKITHVIGISAFGDMLLWEENRSEITVEQWRHWVTQTPIRIDPAADAAGNKGSRQITVAIYLGLTNSEQYDENGDELFERCLAAYGPVKPGQIYAPRLAPAFGGTTNLEDFRIVSALEAMAINVQMAPFHLMDFSEFDKPRVIRQIGSA